MDMVGPSILLMKMLHCKRTRSRIGLSKHKDTPNMPSSSSSYSLGVNIKIEHVEESLCRVCLKEGNLPIYGNHIVEDVSEALVLVGGIEIRVDDMYPKYLCSHCYSTIQNAILLRKTAQNSEKILKQSEDEINKSIYDEDNRQDYEQRTSFDYDTETDEKCEEKSYYCKRCEVGFVNYEDYQEHKLTEEHETAKKTCPVCNKSLVVTYYKKHMALHTNKAAYMCDICGKHFIQQNQFARHRATHFLDLPYKCSLCPYRGRFSESLKMHLRSHTGEKPYQCDVCPARFVNKSNLNKHSFKHKSERPFKCESCGRGFNIKRDLEMHYKVDHTGIKEHVCNICGKAFGYRKQMMKHQLKVHKREKLRSGRTPLYIQAGLQQGEEVEN